VRIVVADASAIAEYLLRTPQGVRVSPVIEATDHDLHVPALCDVEIAAVLRRLLLAGRLSEGRAHEALADYNDLPLTRHGHVTLLPRIVALRTNFTAYDAAYVALAESLPGSLVTADQRLARALAALGRVTVHDVVLEE
jgi:predicted nucleic acid-binding protein